MPAAAFEWVSYDVRLLPDSPVRPRSRGAADAVADTVTVELPNLAPWPSPLDKAEILLESAAEIEHSLMVQYLYAAYSLKRSDEVSEPAQQAALDESSPESWPQTLLAIAREEMGHLLTVQNLLLLLGLPPNLEREDFPPRKDLYPFSLHLEPLSQRSLAKYVVAESPAGASGIEDIVELAQATAGAAVNRVGIVYGLLGVVFSTAEQVVAGGSGSAGWDALVRQLAVAAHAQAAPEAWHLPDGAFQPPTVAQQGEPADWQVGDLRVHRIGDRAGAIAAIRDVGEQGEGATDQGTDSHFARLRRMYRGGSGMAPFPAAGDWVPTRDVPTDPKVEDITEPGTRRWAELTDLRYALLLGFLEHYLLSAGDDRQVLAGWIFAEMRSRLAFLALTLTGMPRAGDPSAGVAAIPFTLPARLHLPGAETARWELHRQRTEAAIAKAEEMQGAGDLFLTALLESDRARRELIARRAAAPAAATSFSRDILPLFRPRDIEHMTDLGLDLSRYDEVRASADEILTRVRSAGPRRMPPAPDQHWTAAQIALLERWIAEEFPP